MSQNLTVDVKAPKGLENAPVGANSKGFWFDSEVGCSIHFRLIGMAPEGIAKTSKNPLVEVELLQDAIVNSRVEGKDEQIQIVAKKGDVCWVNVRLKIELLTRFAIAGMTPDVFLKVEQKTKTSTGNDLFIYAFQHSPDAFKQLLLIEKREKEAAQMAAAVSHPLS